MSLITDVYKSPLLKHPLTEEESNLVPEAWTLLKIFKRRFIFITDYRKYLIKEISVNYTPEKFLKLETVLNKMMWNLRWLLFPLWTNPNISKYAYMNFLEDKYEDFDNLPYSLTLCESKTLPTSDREELKRYLKQFYLGNTFYRSFINKLVIVDKDTKKIITKPMEGSSTIFSKNFFNLMTGEILFSQDAYKKVMSDPFIVKNRLIMSSDNHYYYQLDYGFPNLNFCVFSVGSDEDKLDRVKKMYFVDGPRKDRFWFKLLI